MKKTLQKRKLYETATRHFAQGDFFHFILTDKQRHCIEQLASHENKFVLFGGGAGGGKSWLGCEWLIWSCLSYPGTKWFIGREELKRLRSSTAITFDKVAKKYKLVKAQKRDESGWDYTVNGQDNFIEFANGSRIDFLDLRYMPRDPLYERYGSVEYTGGFIEEGGEVNFAAFDVLKSRMGRHMNDQYNLPPTLLITCNPKKNWLKRMFYDPWTKGELRPGYCFIQALYTDNEFRESSYDQNLEEIHDKSLRARLRDGSWDYDDNPLRIIDDKAIYALYSNKWIGEKGGQKWITGDVARLGSDLFTIWVWKGWKVIDLIVIKKCKLHEAYRVIEATRIRHSVPKSNVMLDEDGVGGGLVDFGGYMGHVSNSRPIQIEGSTGNYRSLGDQAGFIMAQKLNKNELWIGCDVSEEHKELIQQDLESIEMMPRNENEKLRIIPKDKIKEKIQGRSPDFWDGLKIRAIVDGGYSPLSDPNAWSI